jgi:hypothetical protein
MKIILKEPFILFEIENFLDHQTYDALNKSFPKININKWRDHQDGKFGFDNDSDEFKIILKNKLNELFFKKISSKKFQIFFFLRFFLYYIQNRPRYFLKNILPNFFLKKVKTKIQYSYILNNGFIHPHTDGTKKLISLMLYFPQTDKKEEEELGTIFWKFNKPNYNSERLDIDKLKNFEKIKLPFKKRNLYGFIRNPYSWHAVEKFNIKENYVRRSININFNLI